MGKVTIRDVAKRAGVGVGTVSRVLNDSPDVSRETRTKVLTAINQLGYRPSSVARSLSKGERSLAVGIIVPFFTRPAFVGRLQGIEAVLAQSQYDLILYNVETQKKCDALFLKIPNERRVDGLISISLLPSKKSLELFRNANMPVVLVDAAHPELFSIEIDDIDGGRQVTQHLVDLGHRDIAFISDQLDSYFGSRASKKRFIGYQSVIEENGLPFKPEYHRQGEYSRSAAYNLTQGLLMLDAPPTAIFATSDTLALGVIEAIRQSGLKVPEDISVVGYDDIEVAATVRLTTIHQPLYQSGVEGAEALLQLLDHSLGDEELPNSFVLPVSLAVRDTTGPPSTGYGK